MSYKISIVLDKRRSKENGKFPVKLRVFNSSTKKDKRYKLNIDLTALEFKTIWINPENKSLRGNNKDLKLLLQGVENRAHDIAKELTPFKFETFEFKYFRKSSSKSNILYYFNLIIDKHLKNDKIGTSESYKYTLNSFKEFSVNENKKPIDKLTFNDINIEWLDKYQKYMIGKGKSFTTIGIYTRTLKAVFNMAIENEDISESIYPFGKNKYKIPSANKVKKALTSEQLRILFNAKNLNINEEKARDFWFFSYACNGMNIKDIALLKYSDIKDDSFSYYRAKTFDKTSEKKQITIYLTEFTGGLIQKYGTKNKHSYIFDIINEDDSIETQYKKIKNFTRIINDHIKRIAKANNLPGDISTYWARHSFATNSIRKGASLEFISEALNHSDLNVTKNYFAGFEDDAKKEFAKSLLEF
ncbi:tyrosine-type recombinase/integrase [Pseudotamlana agarivorans]|uniref:tyrosine-type recombinase/integrase n=1 Tax=Pseudotamlana agarivorans TaxID=481183 RepID=UPI00082EB18B|nr:site-specific integrase [Tamlana agarivorans]